MKTVTFAGTKGGSGRTTLCFALALEAARKYSVFLADLDPQQSLADMWRRREDQMNPLLVEDVKIVMDAARRLSASDYARDYFFVDTPGSNLSVIRDAVSVADVIVLPMQPSPIDLLSQQAVVDLIGELGKADATVLVLNRIDRRSDLGSEARRWLEKHYRFPVFEVAQRAAYVRSAISGIAAGDISRDAAREMSGLWEIIKELADG
jgi:chromosome partitioning protein